MPRLTHASFVAIFSLSAFILGCASPATSPTALARAPEQVVQTLNAKQIATRGDSDANFGLVGLKDHIRPVIDRCRADGGDLIVLSRSDVQFAAKPNGFGAQQAQRLLPTRFACKTSSALLWGATVAYTEPTFFPSQWTGETNFYMGTRVSFLSGEFLERTEPASATSREAQRRVSEDCAARRLAYTQAVRQSPQVGMEVAFGTIVEVRSPMALVQYNSFGRQTKGLDQEWVAVSSLAAGSSCPK